LPRYAGRLPIGLAPSAVLYLSFRSGDLRIQGSDGEGGDKGAADGGVYRASGDRPEVGKGMFLALSNSVSAGFASAVEARRWCSQPPSIRLQRSNDHFAKPAKGGGLLCRWDRIE